MSGVMAREGVWGWEGICHYWMADETWWADWPNSAFITYKLMILSTYKKQTEAFPLTSPSEERYRWFGSPWPQATLPPPPTSSPVPISVLTELPRSTLQCSLRRPHEDLANTSLFFLLGSCSFKSQWLLISAAGRLQVLQWGTNSSWAESSHPSHTSPPPGTCLYIPHGRRSLAHGLSLQMAAVLTPLSSTHSG